MTVATLRRRLARAEAALSPKQAVLAWLAEAHAYPSLAAYVRSLVGQPEGAWPLVRIARQLAAGARAASGARAVPDGASSVPDPVSDALFLVELVLRLNLAAEDVLASGDPRARLAIEDAARRLIEERHLGGRAALFADLTARWGAARTKATDGGRGRATRRRNEERAAVQARANALVAVARAAALSLLGHDEASAEVTARLLGAPTR